jgi:DNA polymerase III epsilon subunit family exonuclease
MEREARGMQQSLFAVAVAEAPGKGNWLQVLNKSLAETVFTVIDTETTGLNPKKSELIEITAIQYQGGKDIGMFSTLIKPVEPISPESAAIHKITDEMVQNAPPLITVLSDLCAFVGANPVIAAHNAVFDIGFLREKLTHVQLSSFLERFEFEKSFCTKALAKKLMPGLPSYEGVQLAGHLGITNLNAHRAEADVRMCAEILFALTNRLPGDITCIQDLLDYQGILKAS